MRDWTSFPYLQFLITSTCLVSTVTCYYDRYWNGKPDPIGIDFAATYAIAVYADSENNFTVLGLAYGSSEYGNNYVRYVEALHAQAANWGSPNPITDDSAQFESDRWYEQAASRVSSSYQKVKWRACRTVRPLLKTDFFHQICCPNNAHEPRLPESKYRHLVSQYERTMQLKRLVPKFFRPSTIPQSLTTSEFVFLIYQLLVDLKSQAQKEQNISITSAVLGVPPWVPHKLRDLFDEAALLASIGTFNGPFDKPYNRVELSVKTASPSSQHPNKTVMVLDHGQYHFSAHHFVRNKWNASVERFSSRATTLGSLWIWVNLGTRLIDGLNSNVTEEEKILQGSVSGNELLKVIDARKIIKHGTHWPENLEFTNRSKSVNITEFSGRMRPFNMTGVDVQETEEQYTAHVIGLVQHLLLRHDMMTEHLQARPNWETISKLLSDERWNLSLDIAASVAPPADTGSWFSSVDELIILDDGWETELLHQAARKALGWKDAVRKNGKGVCIPAMENAARGAALQAMQLVRSYENRQREAIEMRESHDERLRKQGWDGKENRAWFLRRTQEEYMKELKDERDEI